MRLSCEHDLSLIDLLKLSGTRISQFSLRSEALPGGFIEFLALLQGRRLLLSPLDESISELLAVGGFGGSQPGLSQRGLGFISILWILMGGVGELGNLAMRLDTPVW